LHQKTKRKSLCSQNSDVWWRTAPLAEKQLLLNKKPQTSKPDSVLGFVYWSSEARLLASDGIYWC
jgi:hypothetical protein